LLDWQEHLSRGAQPPAMFRPQEGSPARLFFQVLSATGRRTGFRQIVYIRGRWKRKLRIRFVSSGIGIATELEAAERSGMEGGCRKAHTFVAEVSASFGLGVIP